MFRKRKETITGILCALLVCLTACSPKENIMKNPCPEKLAEYLYYMELDEYCFEAMPQADSPMFTVGCSSVRKGGLYGRNLDLGYCELPEFIVRISKADGRFASIGICADPMLACSVSEMTAEDLLAMPNVTNDGINENGVIISENVVDATGIDDMTGTAPGKEKIHSSRIVRYLLDRAESAAHAVELMKDVDIVGGFSGYGLHWMIADKTDTYVVEIIDGNLVVNKNEQFYLTNFYLNHGPEIAEQSVAGTVFENVPLLNDYAIGVERWCILRDRYSSLSSVEDMAELLESVRATATYDTANDPLWYSECIGGALSIHSETADFEKELARQIRLFEVRDRANPQGDWITWHSSIYDIANRTLYVYSQEDYTVRFQISAP